MELLKNRKIPDCEYTKDYLLEVLKKIEKSGWGFDDYGKLWTRETVSLRLLTIK